MTATPTPPPPAAPDPLAELERAKAAFDDPTTDREASTRALAVAAILAYHDLSGRLARLSALEQEAERLRRLPKDVDWTRVLKLAHRVCGETPKSAAKVGIGTALIILLNHLGWGLAERQGPPAPEDALDTLREWVESSDEGTLTERLDVLGRAVERAVGKFSRAALSSSQGGQG